MLAIRAVQACSPSTSYLPHAKCRAFLAPVPRPLTRRTSHVVKADTSFFDTSLQLSQMVKDQLAQPFSPGSLALISLGGLATSLSPCTLSVLPLTIGYIGGYAQESTDEEGAQESTPFVVKSTCFALGLATTLAGLGIVSTSIGKAYGQIGAGLPIAVSLVAIAMGLNLLEVLPLRLPSVDLDPRDLPVPSPVKAYLAGATFALAASPCSTPVLATILAYVSTLDDPVYGGVLLFFYALGYVSPLLVAATATGALGKVLRLRQSTAWLTPASGFLLLAGGTYSLLFRALPS